MMLRPAQIRKFLDRENDYELEMERGDGEYFDPSLVQLERVSGTEHLTEQDQ